MRFAALCAIFAPVLLAQDAARSSALVDKYCVACHSQAAKTAGLVLQKRDFAQIPEEVQVWEKVIRKVRAGEMPPQGMPKPDHPAMDEFATYLETTLDQAAAAHPNPG